MMAFICLSIGCLILGNEYGASAGFAVFFIALATS
jgi:hypothetical protein